MDSMVSVQSRAISSFQNPLRRSLELPHMKFSVCHFSSWTFISWGEPSPARMGMTPGMGFSLRNWMYSRTSLHSSMNSLGRATLTSLVPRTTTALSPLSPMTAPMPWRLALERPCSMEAKKTRFSPARPMAATWTRGSFNSLAMSSAVSTAPLPCR